MCQSEMQDARGRLYKSTWYAFPPFSRYSERRSLCTAGIIYFDFANETDNIKLYNRGASRKVSIPNAYGCFI